mmetsp:Transcript_9995/g.22990  ORF Transcript_9995/g.22990 Transcript_9995/m.22990 type:complete len:95 (+) Transcript_9995:373-657(+)
MHPSTKWFANRGQWRWMFSIILPLKQAQLLLAWGAVGTGEGGNDGTGVGFSTGSEDGLGVTDGCGEGAGVGGGLGRAVGAWDGYMMSSHTTVSS